MIGLLEFLRRAAGPERELGLAPFISGAPADLMFVPAAQPGIGAAVETSPAGAAVPSPDIAQPATELTVEEFETFFPAERQPAPDVAQAPPGLAPGDFGFGISTNVAPIGSSFGPPFEKQIPNDLDVPIVPGPTQQSDVVEFLETPALRRRASFQRLTQKQHERQQSILGFLDRMSPEKGLTAEQWGQLKDDIENSGLLGLVKTDLLRVATDRSLGIPSEPSAGVMRLATEEFKSVQQRMSDAQNRPGRISSARGSLMQGAFDVVASVPENFAISRARSSRNLVDAFEAIERGEVPDSAGIMFIDRFGIGKFQSAEPEERRAMLARARHNSDPRNRSSFDGGQHIRDVARREFPTNREFEGDPFGDVFFRDSGKALATIGTVALLRQGGIGAASANVVGAAGVNALTERVEQFQDALADGASIEEAHDASNLGAISGTAQAFPIARILSRFDKGTGGTVRRALIEGGIGGSEAMVFGIADNIVENLIASNWVRYDPERDTFEGVGDNADVSFTRGALFSVVAAMLGAQVNAVGQRGDER